MRVAYLIPEFPGQTHVWMWRELTHLREWGLDVGIFSTRRPSERDRARHAFAEDATRSTFYLWPSTPQALVGALIWAVVTRPVRLWAGLSLAWGLPVEGRWRRLRTSALVPLACLLARRLEQGSFRHIHCHSCASSAILAMIAKRLTGIPFSVTVNANLEWWGGAIEAKFRDAHFVVSIASWLLNEIRWRVPEVHSVVLGRIGVDTEKWSPPARRVTHVTGRSRILTVGRLHPSKGHDLLIRAVSQLVARGLDVEAEIVGEGPERAKLEALAAELGSGRPRVVFAGSLSEDQVIERMSSADVFVLASHAEPLGVVYMEAMSMGVPTIGTAAGGVGEIITDGVDGILVPTGDVGALAEAIQRILTDAGLRARLAEAGRRKIVESFDSRIGARTLFRQLTGADPSVPGPP